MGGYVRSGNLCVFYLEEESGKKAKSEPFLVILLVIVVFALQEPIEIASETEATAAKQEQIAEPLQEPILES